MVTLPAEVKKSLVLTDLQARTCEGKVVLLFKNTSQQTGEKYECLACDFNLSYDKD